MSALEVEAQDHADLWHLCELISRTIYGAEAQTILDRGRIPGRCSLLVLPTWTTRIPKIDMGRKTRGGEYFPVRVDWQRPVVAILTDTPAVLPWKIRALGIREHGEAYPRVGTGLAPAPHGISDGLAAVAMSSPMWRDDVENRLRLMVEDGKSARWELLELVDHVTERALTRAHMGLIREYAEFRFGSPSATKSPLIHPEILEDLRSRLVFGGVEDAVDDVVMIRTLADMHAVNAFDKVDPQRWLKVRIGRIARYWIRRVAGDNDEGPKIRRAAKELGTDDPALLAAHLPGIGRQRIEAAINLQPHPDVRALRFGYDRYRADEEEGDSWLELEAAAHV